jgi:hypothetical protein
VTPPMGREALETKVSRLLATGSVDVLRVDLLRGRVLAGVQDDTGRWRVERDERGWWSCDCPSFGPCSHAKAVVLVVPR